MNSTIRLPDWVGQHRPLFREMSDWPRHVGCHVWTEVGADSRVRVFNGYSGWLLVKGEGTYTDWNDKTWDIRPGSFAQYIPGRPHLVRRKDPTDWCELSISLAPRYYDAAVALGIIDPETAVMQPGLSLAFINRFYRCHQSLAAAKHTELRREIPKLLDLLLRLRELAEKRIVPDPMTDLIEEAKVELSGGFDRMVDLPSLVEKYPVSYDHFRRVFREKTGTSPGQYRLLKRIELAELHLAEGGMPIKRVAELLGYADRFVFSKQFKKATGLTPGEYLAQKTAAAQEV